MASPAHHRRPFLAFTQGDPAGVGPELLLKLAAAAPPAESAWRPLWVAERAALAAAAPAGHDLALRIFDRLPEREELEALPSGEIPLVDQVGERRRVTPGRSDAAVAGGALAAIDAALDLARSGAVDGIVTGPVAKDSIARHRDATFRGHTDYLAKACGLEEYGRDYLMAFLTPDLQVALLSTHLPLAEAIARVTRERIESALSLLAREAGGRVAVAGLNPHAGEGGLMGSEDEREIRPAVGASGALRAKSAPKIPASGLDFEAYMEDLQRDYFQEALRRSGGVQVKAAELLGIPYRSFRHYMRKFNVTVEKD